MSDAAPAPAPDPGPDPRRGFRPRALGEVAIRCADMPAMVAFYRDVIGLQLIRGGPEAAISFFRIAPRF